MTDNNLIIKISGKGPYSINPSNTKRDWMDATANSHAYRCLPMTTINSHGWTVNLEKECVVEWDGTDNPKSVRIIRGPGEENVAGGFVTFRLPYVFRTPADYYLWCGGQPNYKRNDMVALDAIVRADWYPSTFQITWKLLKPGRIVFEKGMPIMFFMPYPKNIIDSVNIELYDLEPDDKEAIMSNEYGKYIFRSSIKIKRSPDSWKEWMGLYRKGKYSQKSEALVEDAMWTPKPSKPEKKD